MIRPRLASFSLSRSFLSGVNFLSRASAILVALRRMAAARRAIRVFFMFSFLYLGLGCTPFIFTCRSLGLFMLAMFSGFSARCHSSHIVWEVLAWVLLSDAIGPKSIGSLGPVMVWIGVVML